MTKKWWLCSHGMFRRFVPFFNKYRAGFIVKNEVSELTTALKKILIDQEFIKEDCRKIISDNYDIKKIKEIYKNIYFT